ncbi:nucleoporin-domain-containing protein [Gonapodya prolifera JEL478]|uniref:Nucleoporin-domain-containing protein n=1 Tax=Gonapodya prolifera (strain JEL478) TaxID=1344416 RepID=A0A139ARH7_GONPJ|nr:nucleoporin-domain-containing protein [Gonapodya prolifera JEL478]|eukprot:KXS19356.1 nucleoporin-domain-containing protein [Gonapodya prolifera JEL478]
MLLATDVTLNEIAAQVSAGIESDEKIPDLADALTRPVPRPFEYHDPPFWPPFKRQNMIPLPDALLEQYDSLRIRSFMGLFPEISRAWVTIDNRLILWDYESQSDLFMFEDQEQVILSVAIAKPMIGVFIDTVQYLLVVATPLEVFLLGITFSQTPDPDRPWKGGLVLYKTEMTTPSDDASITSIASTSIGRIFMGGSNGHLFELTYQAEEGWFTRKCQKVDHTSKLRYYLGPLWGGESDPIVGVTVDDCRNLLYSWTQAANVELLYLGEDGLQFHRIATLKYNDIFSSLKSSPLNFQATNFRIVALDSIFAEDSKHFQAVMTTSTGHRVFLGCWGNNHHPGGKPTCINTRYVLPPPSSTLSDKLQEGYDGALYSNGVWLASNCISDSTDLIICTSRDHSTLLSGANNYSEYFGVVENAGRTWSISEKRAFGFQNMSQALLNGSELVRQFVSPQRRFYVLTNLGVTELVKQRPVDVLLELIQEVVQIGNQTKLQSFFQSTGPIEGCAMCLAIVCRNAHLSIYTDDRTTTAALRYYHELGTPNGTSPAVAPPVIVVPQANRPFGYSGRVLGVLTYLQRVAKTLWKTTLAKQLPDGRFYPSPTPEECLEIQSQLQILGRALESTLMPSFVDSEVETSTVPQKTEFINAERGILTAIKNLVASLAQSLELWRILRDSGFGLIAQRLSSVDAEAILSLTFAEFSMRPNERASHLATALVRGLLEVGFSSDELKDRCPSIFSAEESILYEAHQMLSMAQSTMASENKAEFVADVVRLIKESPRPLTKEELRNISQELKNLGFGAVIVEICLWSARKVDPNNESLEWLKHGGDMRLKMIYHNRLEAYDAIVDLLRQDIASASDGDFMRLPSFQIVLRCDDVLLHFTVYEWLINSGYSHYLLLIQSKTLEMYLRSDSSPSKRLLLCQYLVRQKQYGDAAKILCDLAEIPRDDISLSRRLELLASALASLRSTQSGDGEAASMADEVNEKLEVANIQNQILQSLHSRIRQGTLDGVTMEEAQHLEILLDSSLYPISELYKRFAAPLRLHDNILQIFKVSGYHDVNTVRSIWEGVVQATRSEDALITRLQEAAQCTGGEEALAPLLPLSELFCETTWRRGYSLSFPYNAMTSLGLYRPVTIITAIANLLDRKSETQWRDNILSILKHSVQLGRPSLAKEDQLMIEKILNRLSNALRDARQLDTVKFIQTSLKAH